MGLLGLSAARTVITQARAEMKAATAPVTVAPRTVTIEIKRR
jgi:hypothetical protein